jgi:hypothetical protein
MLSLKRRAAAAAAVAVAVVFAAVLCLLQRTCCQVLGWSSMTGLTHVSLFLSMMLLYVQSYSTCTVLLEQHMRHQTCAWPVQH